MSKISKIVDKDGVLRNWKPEDVAQMFAHMSSDEQAAFFNAVADIAERTFVGGCLDLQLQYITEEDGLTDAGRRVMQSIGDYSHWGIHSIIFREVSGGAA